MSTEFVGCKPGDLLAETPRAFFRFTIRRRDLFPFVSVQEAGNAIIDNMAGQVPASALHQTATVLPGSNLAVIDARVTTLPGSATVLDLANKIEDMSMTTDLARVERFASVPPSGIAGIAAGRVSEADRAAGDPALKPLSTKVSTAAKSVTRITVNVIVGVAIVAGVTYYLLNRKAG